MERNDTTAMTEEERAARRARRSERGGSGSGRAGGGRFCCWRPFWAAGVIAVVLLSGLGHREKGTSKDAGDVPAVGNAVVQQPKEPQELRFVPEATAATALLGDEIPSAMRC